MPSTSAALTALSVLLALLSYACKDPMPPVPASSANDLDREPQQPAQPATGEPPRDPTPAPEARQDTPQDTPQAAPQPTGSAESANSAEPAEPPTPSDPSLGTWSFDDARDGELPAGWSAPVGQWAVAQATGASDGLVLVQTAKNRSPVFNMALVDDIRRADVDLTVRMRALSGRIDQGGGLVWRAADARNYYVARYNPLEDNYRVYEVVDGRRKQLGSASIAADREAWHTLRVQMVGDHIRCFLDGEPRLDVRDDTFTGAGTFGLWTKADARTEFDDLTSSAPGDAP
ncbi:MAG: hypothetical protein PVI30_23645 [Myxococcales bacterium]|jgi:hypothetical protein